MAGAQPHCAAICSSTGIGKPADSTVCCDFLSNLQKFPLEKWPAILAPQECKKLYTQLFSNPVKVKEALGKFVNDGSEGAVIPVLTLWAPNNQELVLSIAKCLKDLFTNTGKALRITFLVPYSPLPGCRSAGDILDLRTHPLLKPQFKEMVINVKFLEEASRCVFSREGSPHYAIKNIVAITIQPGGG